MAWVWIYWAGRAKSCTSARMNSQWKNQCCFNTMILTVRMRESFLTSTYFCSQEGLKFVWACHHKLIISLVFFSAKISVPREQILHEFTHTHTRVQFGPNKDNCDPRVAPLRSIESPEFAFGGNRLYIAQKHSRLFHCKAQQKSFRSFAQGPCCKLYFLLSHPA